ncbi:MAG: DNA polymerase III subunit gamma/tau [Oscillospiraceae bacterium]|nr:DNA polymerase III subunit gamma/tau [Oscillospiraceae bacterium]
MYQVLYRKWRPKVFADVVGQPQVTETLKKELSAGRIAHAYLFTGSRGTGKTTCAKILAKAVNCLHPVDGDPCGVCEICREADAGSILDIVEIDAASNNGVDNIRALREEANFTPSCAKYRVYIIDEVHMLSQGAFNALLKTLEEPPAHVIFILATTEVHKLPATILSRCQRFDFRRIPPADIAGRLRYVAEQEGASIDEEGALLIARLADGALRDALSLLDQCIGLDRTVTTEVVNQTVGIAGKTYLYQLTEAVAKGQSAEALALIDTLHNGSKDMMRLCEELCGHFRSLMMIKTTKAAEKILMVSSGEFSELKQQALPIPLPTLLHAIDTLQSAMERMSRGADQRIALEMALIKLCDPSLDASPDALLRRIDALERRLLSGQAVGVAAEAVAAPQPSLSEEPAIADEPVDGEQLVKRSEEPVQEGPQIVPAEETAPPKKRTAKAVSVEALSAEAVPFDRWPEVLQLLKESSRSVSAAFTGSSAYINGSYLLIDATNSMAFELLRREEQRQKMRDTIRQVTGRDYKLGPYKRPQTEAEKDDPLELLARQAEQAGIEVIKNT